MKRQTFALALLFFAAACSEVIVPADKDGSVALDASSADATTTIDAMAGPDARPQPLIVNCRVDPDCQANGGGSKSICIMEAPGGTCSCNGTTTCNTGYTCVANEVCVRDCTSDTECNPGMFCNINDHCVPLDCSFNSPCPPPYICSEGAPRRCQRPTCQPTSPICPVAMSCTNVVSVCVED